MCVCVCVCVCVCNFRESALRFFLNHMSVRACVSTFRQQIYAQLLSGHPDACIIYTDRQTDRHKPKLPALAWMHTYVHACMAWMHTYYEHHTYIHSDQLLREVTHPQEIKRMSFAQIHPQRLNYRHFRHHAHRRVRVCVCVVCVCVCVHAHRRVRVCVCVRERD